MRTREGKVEVEHYLRERAAPGGRAVAWGSARPRWVKGNCCCGGAGVGELRLPHSLASTPRDRFLSNWLTQIKQNCSKMCTKCGKISAKCRSFSAVSAPIFARKYAFCSIFQNLPDFLAEEERFESYQKRLKRRVWRRLFANI